MTIERLRVTVDALCEHIASEEGIESLFALFGSVGLKENEMIELGWLQKE